MSGWRTGIELLACALVLGGCGHSSGATAPTVPKTDNVRAAYNAAVAGLDGQYFDSMSMSAPTQMRQVLLLPGGRAGQFVAEWEGALAAGGTAARLTRSRQLTFVDVFEHTAGDAIPPAEEFGFSIDGPALRPARDSDSELEAHAASVLREFHLTAVSVRVLHPYGPALFVHARTDDSVTVSGRMGDLETALDSGHEGLEGLYVAVDGPDGPLFRGQSARRISEGGQWFAKGFDSGIPHG
jgi:hypothetical protein